MIAGNPTNNIEKIICAIREICPNMGFIKKENEVILTGNEIEHLKRIRDILSQIEDIVSIDKYGTAAILKIRDMEGITDIIEDVGADKLCITA